MPIMFEPQDDKHDFKTDADLSKEIGRIRAQAEARVKILLNRHMRNHYPDARGLWEQCTRSKIEVESWPNHKQRHV